MLGKGQPLNKDEMHKAFRFRLLPTPDQEILLSKHFGCVRFIYNHFLTEKKEHYIKDKTTSKFNECASALVAKKKEEGFEWLKEVNSQALLSALLNLETAYTNFFKKKAKFPTYKSKRGSRDSFHVPQHTEVRNSTFLHIPKFKEGIKFNKHREIQGDIRSCSISRTPTGKYYVSVLCVIKKPNTLSKTGQSIGIDLGLKDFLITSEGQRYANPRHTKKYASKLRIKQKTLSRKQKGSKRRELARKGAALVYEKITNSRNDMQHKISLKLIQNYDLIAIEDLNVKGMVKNHCLAKAISDVAWSSFVTKLKYKAEWYGKEVFVIDRFFPSSKTCSCCNHIKQDLTLEERSWTCSDCGTKHDRDVNAAKNVLQRALTIKSSGTDDYRHGAGVRPKEVTKVASGGTGYEVSKKKDQKILKPSDV